MPSRKIDIFDLLPEEAMKAIDKQGYDFLASKGYDTEGAIESEYKRKEIKRTLMAEKKELTYRGVVDKDSGAMLVWFELMSGDKIERSQGIKFVQKSSDEGGGND
ncbi:MAG: hypothetical protein RSB59_07245, partial [Clostridia bacterium]